MILTPNDLPSKGLYVPTPTPIYLRPLNFMEILEYSNEVTGNSIKEYLRDIKWLMKLDPNIKNHSLYDLDYLIFMMKVHTISDNKTFSTDIECPKCGTKNRIEISLDDFSFIDVEKESERVKRVKLGGTTFNIKVPTIETFAEVLYTYSLYMKTDKAEIPKLVSLFAEFSTMPNHVEEAIFNANRNDISILYMLEMKYLSSTNPIKRTCSNCNDKGGMAIGISSLIANMFRDVLLNNAIDDSQVQFE